MRNLIMGDFVTFVAFAYGNDWKTVIRNFLRMEPDLFTDAGFGGIGYQKSVAYNGIRVYYEGREELNEYEQTVYPMGVCVSMSGDGCRAFEDFSETYQIIDLLAFLLPYADNDDVHITRLDIAADDKEGFLDIGTIWRYIKTRQTNTRLEKKRLIEDIPDGGHAGGMTIYIGSTSSAFRFRIYDKAKEQGDYESHWIRVEMVCRDEYAEGAARQLVAMRDRIGECVAGMIKARLDFIELDHTRRTNCTVAAWWTRFLEVVQAIEFFAKEKPVRTADKLHDWIYSQLAASLATAREIFGDSFIGAVLADGRQRLNRFQRALVSDYFASQGLPSPFVM